MLKTNRFCVYLHETPDGRKYVGMTRDVPERRFKNGKGYVSNKSFYSEIERVGWDNIKHTIIAEDLTLSEAAKVEADFVRLYNTTSPEFGFNKQNGGRYISQEAIDSKCKECKTATAIRNFRKQAGLTQKQLAAALKIVPSTVCMWEKSQRLPRFKELAMLSKIFNCSVETLL